MRNTLQLFLTYCVISQNYSIVTESETEDSINIMREPSAIEHISSGCRCGSGTNQAWFSLAPWAVPSPEPTPTKEKHGSKILIFPMPAMGAQELREGWTNGNTHTAELSGWLSPKLIPEKKGYIPTYVMLREVERKARRMSAEAACFAASSWQEEKLKSSNVIFALLAAPLGLQLPREKISYRATCQTHPKDLFDGSEILGNVVAVLCHVYS